MAEDLKTALLDEFQSKQWIWFLFPVFFIFIIFIPVLLVFII